MKKFKNIKLMLLGLLAMGSVNAFAAVGDYKTDGTYWYEVIDEARAEVALVGYSNVADPNPTSLVIKDKVSLKDDQLKDKDYTVITAYKKDKSDQKWWEQVTSDAYTQSLATVTSIKELTINIRIDGEGPSSVGNEWCDIVTPLLTAFGANLETLFVKEAYMIGNLPAFGYTSYPKLKTINFGGVTNGGSAITLPYGFVYGMDLSSLTLPNEKLKIGQEAFAYVNSGYLTGTTPTPTALVVDTEKAIEIGQQAFFDANVATVTIGEELSDIGADAFQADNTVLAFLTSVEWKSNKLLNPSTPNLPYVPAVFDGQDKINNIKISAKNVNLIADGAFDDITGNVAVDLTGAVALTAINNAFGTGAAAPKFTSLKLKDAPLKAGTPGKVSDIVDLTNSKATLTEISLPSSITTLEGVVGTESFASFTALTTLDMEKANITAIPDNGFKDCTALKSFTLPNATTTIGKYAFYNTALQAISIPAAVTSIGEYAFAEIPVVQDGSNKWYKGITLTLADNSNLASLGKGVFENTNIDGTVDFTKTGVKAIPVDAFAKKANFWNTSTSGWTAKYALKEVKFNAGTDEGANAATIGNNAFKNNIALATADLNKAFLTSIGTSAFENTALTTVTLTDSKVKSIASSAFAGIATLTTATLNEETTDINANAFDGDTALETVNFDKLTKLADIDDYAFNQSAIKELNFKNCAALTHIGERAFGQYVKNEKQLEDSSKPEEIKATLTKITFPEEKATDPESTDADWNDKYSNKINDIEEAAFFAANKVTTIENEEALKIWTLNQWFTDNDEDNIDLATSDSWFDELEDDQIRYCPDGLTEFTLPSVTWYSKDKPDLLSGAVCLTTVNHYALQGLGISEITIPGSVSYFGGCVLQGCLNLTKFEFNDCDPDWPYFDGSIVDWYTGPGLHKYTFRGNSNLEKCYFMTTDQMAKGGLTDDHFFWCSKEKLTVYVTSESLLQLRADGYTTANAKYSKLNDEIADEYTFSDKGYSEKDGAYYGTYFNEDYSTWFDAEEVDVFTAVVKGNQIEMVPAEKENGFYKIKKYTGSNDEEAVAILRSKKKTVVKNLFAIPANDISTLAKGQNDLEVADYDQAVSKLTFQFKLGYNKTTKSVGFFRVKTGTFKEGTVFIQASSPARFADFIEINGDETGIKTFEAVENEDGAIYNLQGIRVNEAQKGMYIKNGKKFVK